jgi:hypothetical protein
MGGRKIMQTLFRHHGLKRSQLQVTISFFLVVLFFLTSCDSMSKDLSRSKAKSLLEKKKGVVSKLLDKSVGAQFGPDALKDLRKLESAGYIKLTEVPNGVVLGVSRFDVTIFDKLKPYIVERTPGIMGGRVFRVKIADVVVDEVTGITPAPGDPTARVVQYKIKTIPTPLANIGINLYDNEKAPLNQEALFRKYDDGWRLEQ